MWMQYTHLHITAEEVLLNINIILYEVDTKYVAMMCDNFRKVYKYATHMGKSHLYYLP